MDVFAGRKIHHRVGAPFRSPTHFLHFFFDARSNGAIADIGIDFDEEITADDHRLALGVIDIGGNNGAAAGHLLADEFRSDNLRNPSPERNASEVPGGAGRARASSFAPEVLANGNE